MAQENDQEKSLPASQRRIEKAREEGNVARSAELATAAALGVTSMIAGFAGPMAWEKARGILSAGLTLGRADAFDTGRLVGRMADFAIDGLIVIVTAGATLALGAVAAMLAVGGWNFTAGGFAPKASRLSPLSWLERTFSLAGAGELAKTVAKSFAIGAVVGWFVWSQRESLATLAATPLPAAIALTGDWTRGVFTMAALAAAGVAALDVPFQIWRHHSNLRMTLQEAKEEHRETEGDPMLKARIRSQQREVARRRMMSEVPKADVIVTNPTHYAVALKYVDGSMAAPRVVAKGTDHVAAKIREIAAEAGVPTLEAPPLARALHKHAEVGAEIPAALYGAVAQVLAWVFAIRAGRTSPVPAALEIPAGLDPLETR